MYNKIATPLLFVLTIFLINICLSDAKECIFLHGSGEHGFSDPTSTFPEYWGQVHTFAKQCSSIVFNHADTVDYAFDSVELMTAYSNLAVSGSLSLNYPMEVALQKAGPRVIQNKIIFTHSMGNLVLAAAIKHGYVTFDSNSSSWYDAAGPAAGSPVAKFLDTEICESNSSAVKQAKWIAQKFGYCSGDNISATYMSMIPTYPGLDGIPEIIRTFRTGGMCGTSAWGIFSEYSIALGLISQIVNFTESNDGLVGISGCKDSNTTQFGTSTDDIFYQGQFNHADLTCRNGGDPCDWFSKRT